MEGGGGFSKKPLALVCHMCGREYGTKSLSIHWPKCIEKWWQEQSVLPKKLQISPPAGPQRSVPTDPVGIESWNQEAFQIYSNARTPCPNCGRRFAPDRLLVHLKSCESKDGSDPLAPTGGPSKKPQALVCHLCGAQFGSQSLPIHIPQCIIKWNQNQSVLPKRCQRPPPEGPSMAPPAMKDSQAVQEYNEIAYGIFSSALTPCPYCGRKFWPEKMLVHLKSCDKKGPDDDPFAEGPKSRPKALVCYICGQQFGTTSLAIHQKTCVQKREIEQMKLPPHLRTPLPPPPATPKVAGGASMDEFNDAAYSQFTEGLCPCPNCGRKFAPDRLPVHLRSCKPSATSSSTSAARPSTMTTSTPVKSQPPSSTLSVSDSKPRPQTSAVPTAGKYENGDGDEEEEEETETGGSEGGANMSPPTDEPALVPCSKCGRKFASDRVERHQSSCKAKPTAASSTGGVGSGARSQSRTSAAPQSTAKTPQKTREPPQIMKIERDEEEEEATVEMSSEDESTQEQKQTMMEQGLYDHASEVGDVSHQTERQSSPAPPMPPLSADRRRESKSPDLQWKDAEGAENGTEIEGDEDLTSPVDLVPCQVCGRKFASDRVGRHEQACKKSASKARPRFNASAQRAEGTEIQSAKKSASAPPKTPQKSEKSAKWKTEHDSLMRAVQQAKLIKKIQAEGGSLADLPPPPPDEHPDYLQCPYCSRRFAPETAKRHIPKCKETIHKPKPPPQLRSSAVGATAPKTAEHRTAAAARSSSQGPLVARAQPPPQHSPNPTVQISKTAPLDLSHAPTIAGGSGGSSARGRSPAPPARAAPPKTPQKLGVESSRLGTGAASPSPRVTSSSLSEPKERRDARHPTPTRIPMPASRNLAKPTTPIQRLSTPLSMSEDPGISPVISARSSVSGAVGGMKPRTPSVGASRSGGVGSVRSSAVGGSVAGLPKFCSDCGNKFLEAAKFCSECGKKR